LNFEVEIEVAVEVEKSQPTIQTDSYTAQTASTSIFFRDKGRELLKQILKKINFV